MKTAIQYILTAAQSLGSQDCYKRSRMGVLVYYSAKIRRHRQNGFSYVPKKYLLGYSGKLGEVSKQQ